MEDHVLRPMRLTLFLLLIACAAGARATVEFAGSTSFRFAETPARLTTLREARPLADGGAAYLGDLADATAEDVLAIHRNGRLTIHRAAAFGAAGAPRGRSPFLALATDGETTFVAVRLGPEPNRVHLFSVDATGAIADIADATAVMSTVSSSARILGMIARHGSIVLSLVTGLGPPRPSNHTLALWRDGQFTEVARSATGAFAGIGDFAIVGPRTVYLVNRAFTDRELLRWHDGELRRVIEPGVLVSGTPLRIDSIAVAADEVVALLDSSARHLLRWQAGGFVVLARQGDRTTDGTEVRLNGATLLRVDDTHVYFSGARAKTYPAGHTADVADLILRVPRNGGPIETFFDPRRVFDAAVLPRISLSNFILSGETPRLTFFVREDMGSQQAIYSGVSPFGVTTFPAVPAGYPQIALEDRGGGFSHRGGTRVRLDAVIASATPTTIAWSLDGAPLAPADRRFEGVASPSLTLFPFAQTYHRGNYTLAVTNAAGTSYASSQIDVQVFNYDDGVGKFPPLVNCSILAHTSADEGTLTAGFSLLPPLLSIGSRNGAAFRDYESGTTQRLLVRAIGPGLAPFLGSGAVANATRLTLYSGDAALATNHGAWSAVPEIASVTAAAGAFPLPADSRDSALLLSLAPGNYTAHVAAPAGDGAALIECYVAGGSGSVRNLSARGLVDQHEPRTLNLGFVIAPGAAGVAVRPILLRAIGPGLREFGIANPVAQPVLQLFSGDRLIAENRGHASAPNPAEIAATAAKYGAFPLEPGSSDAALLMVLPAGAYVARITSASGAGVALAELYTNVGF